MRVTFDDGMQSVEVRCNYRWQLEQAIVRFDPFQAFGMGVQS